MQIKCRKIIFRFLRDYFLFVIQSAPEELHYLTLTILRMRIIIYGNGNFLFSKCD